MGLLDRFRRRDDADEERDDDPVGPDAFAELRDLVAAGAPPAAQRAAIERTLRAHGVPAAVVAEYVGGMVDGISLSTEGPTDPRLRLGGDALLPAGEPWPRSPDDRPLSFVAALDLAAVPTLPPLPAAGVLLVFFDLSFHEPERMDFVAATRVFLVPPGQALVPAAPPDGAEHEAPDALSAAVMPFPRTQGRLEEDDVPEGVPGYELEDALADLQGDRLLGAERPIQGPVLEEVAYWFDEGYPATRERFSASELAGEGWAFLAQLGTVGGPDFAAAGALYLVLPRVDLEAGRFDRVMGIVQG